MPPTASIPSQVVVLKPSYRLPLVLAIAGIVLALLQLWLGLALLLFSGFLLFQTATLRLHFTETALDIYRSEQLIRHFPYSDWIHWEIFWSPVPILLYFREVKSIHFLPILFEPQGLQTCLETHCSRIRN